MKRIPSVVIITGISGIDEMLSGILAYVHDHGPWRIYQAENLRWTYNFRAWEQWGADAIIAADHHTVDEASRIAKTGLPTVVLIQAHMMRQKGYPLKGKSCCLWDSAAIGTMAAEYFIARRHRHFAFADDSLKTSYWSVERERAFRKAIAAALPPRSYSYSRYGGATESERRDWMNERPRMMAWLRSLTKPCAIFAPNDRRGKQVLDACQEEGIPVPGEVSVLGCDNYAYVCESALPTLSSIRCDLFSAGYRIAEHLGQMLKNRKIPRVEIPVSPIDVITRQSTDWFAVHDPIVARTLTQIQSRAADRTLSVPNLAQASGIARRSLEIRFKNATGRTLREEIEFVRMSKAKGLLTSTRMSLPEIASTCGFASPDHFCKMFKARFSASPTSWRKSQKPPAA